ncbi:MAG: glycosyltransferase family 4 protein [Herpetosiphonaceae bacterium]|nr:glycosyltransferase family 4 protein [Herpetosiphonaceae bacterium]
MNKTSPLNIVYFSGCEGDTQRYRAHHPAEQLRRLGHNAQVFWQTDPAALTAAASADLIVLHRPEPTHYLEAVLAAAQGCPLVYETDDLIFDRSMVGEIPIVKQNQGYLHQRWGNYALGNARLLERCHAATTSTQPLADRLVACGKPTWLHPNVLSDDLLQLSDAARQRQRPQRPLTIGYFSGTFSHDRDFALIGPALVQLLKKHRSLRLFLGGCLNLPELLYPFAERIDTERFVPWRELPELMAQTDILLAPLDVADPFTRCRSELKYLEAAALAIPMVASPIPAFAGAIQHGANGFLATSVDEWSAALEGLLTSAALRQQVGQAAYDHVRSSYTFAAVAPRLEQILHTVLDDYGHSPAGPRVLAPALQAEWQKDSALAGRSVYMITGCEAGNSGTYRCRHRQQQLDYLAVPSLVVSQPNEGCNMAEAIKYDIAIFHRMIIGDFELNLLDMLRRLGRPIIFDTDDLVFRPELIEWVDAIKGWSPEDKALYRQGVEGYQRALLECDAAIVSTEPLAQMVRELGQRAFVVRNALSWEQIERGQPLAQARFAQPLPTPAAPVVIGYFSGTATHNRDFAEAAPALLQLLAQFPHVRLRIVGPLELEVDFTPFSHQIERRELVPLNDLALEVAAVDIAIAPLEIDNPYCQAKSEVKYMEAGLVGVPLVASPTEAFQVAITPGVNGMLATTTAEWLGALQELVADPARRRAIGQAAHADVLERYTPIARSRQLRDVLAPLWDELASKRRPEAFTEVLVTSIDRFQNLYWTQRMASPAGGPDPQVATLETALQASQAQAQELHEHLERVANGRVMRFLNRLSHLRHKFFA